MEHLEKTAAVYPEGNTLHPFPASQFYFSQNPLQILLTHSVQKSGS